MARRPIRGSSITQRAARELGHSFLRTKRASAETQPEPLCWRDEAIAPCHRGRPGLGLAAGGHDPASLLD